MLTRILSILILLALAPALAPARTAPADDAPTSPTAQPSPTAEPATLDTPEAVVRTATDQVLAVLAEHEGEDKAQRQERRERIRQILLGVVDMEVVGRLTLANFYSKFDEQQFERFVDLFSRLLFDTYISHIEEYSGQDIRYEEARDLGRGSMEVATAIVGDDKEIPIKYRLKQNEERWLIYDVLVEGVSLVKNYRTQYREILLSRDAEYLLERLDKKVRENADD